MKVEKIEDIEKGNGYEVTTTTVTLSGGGGSGATAVVASVNDHGGIRQYEVTNKGSGYTSPPDVIITSPTGSGASARVKLEAE